MKYNKKYMLIIVLITFALIQVSLFDTIISFGANTTSQVVTNGTYYIETALDTRYCLDVAGVSKADEANIALYQKNNQANQRFKITYLSDGYYQILAEHSGKALDVYGGIKKPETNVQQYSKNSGDNQKWKITKNSDGTYSFTAKCNGLNLDVYQAIAGNNRNIQVYTAHSGTGQKFKLDPVKVDTNPSTTPSTTPEEKPPEEETPTQPQNKEGILKEGTYAIKSSIDKNYAINVANASNADEANISLYKYSGFDNQKFKLKHLGNDIYQITSVQSGKALDVYAASKEVESNVEQYTANSGSNQKWKIQKNSDNTYSLISQCNGLYIDVYQVIAENGRNIQMYTGNKGKGQKFYFEEIPATQYQSTTGKTIADGIYSIETAIDSNKVLDIESDYKANTSNIRIYEKQPTNRQKFQVKYLGDGTYSITGVYSNKVLDVEGNGKELGTNVCQYDPGKSPAVNQRWIIKSAGSGYYNIISKSSNLYLDIYGAYTANNTNVLVWSNTNAKNQKFKFVKPTELTIDKNKYPGYKEKIEKLMEVHPGWSFELLYTGLRFEADVIAGETALHARNLVPSTYGGEWVCATCGKTLYDSGWYCASPKADKYYMDPRNFLDDANIFQFQKLNEYIPGVCTLEGIQKKVKGTFLENYAADIDGACKNTNTNPYYIIARLLQEQGPNGTTIGTGMDGGDGKKYYNPFNINATTNGNDAGKSQTDRYNEIYGNALNQAKSSGWDTMQKGLEGGIAFCKKNWLDVYQNTLYTNKFDIDKRSGGSLYNHQYMQNLMAPCSEGTILRSMYVNTNKDDCNFTFVIPVYNDMSASGYEEPVYTVEKTITNVKVKANGGLKLRDGPSGNSKEIRLIPNGTILVCIERGINTSWNKVVLEDGTIGYISGEYLEQVADVTNCNYKAQVKTADGSGCKIRQGPGFNCDVITALSDGTQVTVINENTYKNINDYNWCRIVLQNGMHAFIPSKYLERL